MTVKMTTAADLPEPRIPLTPTRVFRTAIELADAEGIDALTMRNLAAHLGVEAMSIYHHVANKEALLDGVVDTLVGDIESELGGFEVELEPGGWQATLRSRCLAARRVMLRHRWAPAVIESRTMTTPMVLRYMDSIVGIMLAGGLSSDLCHHATHALGSLPLGFNHELFAPTDEDDDRTSDTVEVLAPELPHLMQMLGEIVVHGDPDTTIGWCDDQTEFEFALDALLDGLALRFESERA
jgi:AcrR family transcriptional regulator